MNELMQILRTASNTPYQAHFGDTDTIGWAITVCYLLACIGCLLKVRLQRCNRDNTDGVRLYWFWCVATCVIFLLGVNKQLDLQTWVIEVCRVAAKEGGWYEERRSYQRAFILLIVFLAIALVSTVIYTMRRCWRECGFVAIGFGFLIMFVLVRAISLSHVDYLLAQVFAGSKLRHILELSAVAIIAVATASSFRKSHSSSDRVM